MFFAAPTERDGALLRTPELADLVGIDEAAPTEALASRFALHPVAYWVEVFAGGSTAVAPLGSLHATRDLGLQLESAGETDISQATFCAIRHGRHPMGRWVDLVAPNAVRPAKARITIPSYAPKLSQ